MERRARAEHRAEKVVGYPPLSKMGEQQRREFQEALLEAGSFEDLPGKWQAAILKAEQNRPRLRVCDWRLARSPFRPEAGRRLRARSAAPFRAVWVFVVARDLERRHTRSEER
jgi:hypothetical protein